MPEEKKDVKKDETNKEPIYIRKVITGDEANILKRSKFCKHNNVWGRCPEGC